MKVLLPTGALLATLLGGCGAMPNGASVTTVSGEAFASEKNGVVILSTGAAASCVSHSRFLRVFDARTRKPVDGAPMVPVDPYTNKSEFEAHHGTINGLALPAGRYYFEPWLAQPYAVQTLIPEFRFSVRAGETVYVGEVFMPESCGLNATFVIVDRYERDVKLAIEKNPLLGQRTPVKRLLEPLQTNVKRRP